jgi:hypothetical protein
MRGEVGQDFPVSAWNSLSICVPAWSSQNPASDLNISGLLFPPGCLKMLGSCAHGQGVSKCWDPCAHGQGVSKCWDPCAPMDRMSQKGRKLCQNTSPKCRIFSPQVSDLLALARCSKQHRVLTPPPPQSTAKAGRNHLNSKIPPPPDWDRRAIQPSHIKFMYV